MRLEDFSDEALVKCAQDGDEDAFTELSTRHFDLVYRVAYRMVGNSSDAEDVTQEVLLRIARNIRSFKGTSKVTTWFYRITTNAAWDFLRREVRNEKSKGAVERALVEDVAEMNGVSERVHGALLKLTSGERAAIVLTFYEGLSHAEAAKVLACAETTVSWRIFQSKRKLKKILSEDMCDA